MTVKIIKVKSKDVSQRIDVKYVKEKDAVRRITVPYVKVPVEPRCLLVEKETK